MNIRTIKGEDGVFINADDMIAAIKEAQETVAKAVSNEEKTSIDLAYEVSHTHIIEVIQRLKGGK